MRSTYCSIFQTMYTLCAIFIFVAHLRVYSVTRLGCPSSDNSKPFSAFNHIGADMDVRTLVLIFPAVYRSMTGADPESHLGEGSHHRTISGIFLLSNFVNTYICTLFFWIGGGDMSLLSPSWIRARTSMYFCHVSL